MMTRPLHWLAATAFAALISAPALAGSPSPLGQWQVSTGEARYAVVSCGSGKLCAKLVWLRADARTQDNLALLNRYVVRGAVPKGNGSWQGALTFSGKTYAGTMQMVSGNQMTLKGCSGVLCQTFQLVRV